MYPAMQQLEALVGSWHVAQFIITGTIDPGIKTCRASAKSNATTKQPAPTTMFAGNATAVAISATTNPQL